MKYDRQTTTGSGTGRQMVYGWNNAALELDRHLDVRRTCFGGKAVAVSISLSYNEARELRDFLNYVM